VGFSVNLVESTEPSVKMTANRRLAAIPLAEDRAPRALAGGSALGGPRRNMSQNRRFAVILAAGVAGDLANEDLLIPASSFFAISCA
jgi:hypothetical protein